MRAAAARAAMALAVVWLGDRRRDWALAMRAEFEIAAGEGRAMSFASGCLGAALRDLPSHEEGRFAIASHFVALVLLIPTAALLFSSLSGDFPSSYLGASTPPPSGGGSGAFVNDGNRSAVPPIALLMLGLAGLHLRIAWLVLERDWARVAAAGALIAAATVTLLLFTLVVFAHPASALGLAATLAVELIGVCALARWHVRAFGRPPELAA